MQLVPSEAAPLALMGFCHRTQDIVHILGILWIDGMKISLRLSWSLLQRALHRGMVTSDVVVQIELWEGEVDNLNGVKKKSKAQVQQLQRTEEQIKRHRNHVDRLQQMLRLLDNEAVLVRTPCLYVSLALGILWASSLPLPAFYPRLGFSSGGMQVSCLGGTCPSLSGVA
jgi:hypothetical protein